MTNPVVPNPATLDDAERLQLLELITGKTATLRNFQNVFWPLIEPGRPLVESWAAGCVREHLEELGDIDAGSMRNLVVNMPPRMGKSIQACVFWQPYVWTKHPWTRWMFSSYSHELVTRDSGRCRDIIRHPLYQAFYAARIKDDQDRQVRFTNQFQGFRYAVTTGGQGQGEGADFIVVDDPIDPRRVRSQLERLKVIHWWRSTMSRRTTDEQTTRRLIIMQRLHEEDLTGYLLAEQLGGWDHLVLPMRYEPRRYLLPDPPAPPRAAGIPSAGGDGAEAVPRPPTEELKAELGMPEDKIVELVRSLAAAVEANRVAPRDSIRPTQLQVNRPDLIDGPDGSGRSEAGDVLDPVRFPEAVVAKNEAELGPDAPGQYQQRPSAESGEIFLRESFRYYAVVNSDDSGPRVVLSGPGPDQVREFPLSSLVFFQTIDTALTEKKRSAYTAVVTAFCTPEFDLGLWNVFRARLNVPDQLGVIKALRAGPCAWVRQLKRVVPAGAWPSPIRVQAIEPKASGIGLIQQAGSEGYPLHPLKVDGDKVTRAAPVAGMYRAGKVYHPVDKHRWVAEAEDELLTFPNGTYKDVADCVAYAGYLVIHDRIIRGLAGRPLADTRGVEQDEQPGPNDVVIPTRFGPMVVEFPDDDAGPYGLGGLLRGGR